MADARLTVTVANEVGEITPLLTKIEQFGAETGLDDELTNAIMLVVDEAVVNTISYGYPDGGAHTIAVSLHCDTGSCTVVIEDDGVPFNPLDAPEAKLSGTIEERGVGGLGIHLMRSYMDDLAYRREGDRNILTLVKKRS